MKKTSVNWLTALSLLTGLATLAAIPTLAGELTAPRAEGVTIEGLEGELYVMGIDGNEVFLSFDDEDVHVDMRVRGDRVVITPDDPRHRHDDDAEFTLKMPRDMALAINTEDLDIFIENINSAVFIQLADGDIEAERISGAVSLKTFDGDITLREIDGAMSIDATDGDVIVSSARGNFQAKTVDGDVEISRLESDAVQVSVLDGDIEYRGEVMRGNYSMKTHDGDIEFIVIGELSATVVMTSYNGEMETEFPGQVQERERGKTVIRYGSGTANVSLQAFSGDVIISRGN